MFSETVVFQKGILKNSTKFTGKDLCRSLFFTKVFSVFFTKVFYVFSREFCETLIWIFRKPPVAASLNFR